VAAEMLRLMPPVWMIGRRAVSACDIGGYDIPVGALVEVSPYLLHRDARYFADPLRFDPSRWLPERDWTPVKFSYIPFGAGARGCIGEPFAWLEATTVIACIARRWRLRLAPGTRVEPFAGLTLRPKRAVRMVPLRRHAD
jgi:cytochrome P450